MPRSATVKKLAGKLGIAVVLPKRRNGAGVTGDAGLKHAESPPTDVASKRHPSVRQTMWPVWLFVVAGTIEALVGLGLLLKLVAAGGKKEEKKYPRVLMAWFRPFSEARWARQREKRRGET